MEIYLNGTAKIYQFQKPVGEDGKIQKGWKQYKIEASKLQALRDERIMIDWVKTKKEIVFGEAKLTPNQIAEQVQARESERQQWVLGFMAIALSPEKIGELDTDTRVELLLLERAFEQTGDFPNEYEKHFPKAAIFVGTLIHKKEITNIPEKISVADLT